MVDMGPNRATGQEGCTNPSQAVLPQLPSSDGPDNIRYVTRWPRECIIPGQSFARRLPDKPTLQAESPEQG